MLSTKTKTVESWMVCTLCVRLLALCGFTQGAYAEIRNRARHSWRRRPLRCRAEKDLPTVGQCPERHGTENSVAAKLRDGGQSLLRVPGSERGGDQGTRQAWRLSGEPHLGRAATNRSLNRGVTQKARFCRACITTEDALGRASVRARFTQFLQLCYESSPAGAGRILTWLRSRT